MKRPIWSIPKQIEDLKHLGIRKIGVLKRSSQSNGKTYVTIYFTTDKKVVFPHKLDNLYPLVLTSDADTQKVNDEAIKALKRSLLPGWDEE